MMPVYRRDSEVLVSLVTTIDQYGLTARQLPLRTKRGRIVAAREEFRIVLLSSRGLLFLLLSSIKSKDQIVWAGSRMIIVMAVFGAAGEVVRDVTWSGVD